MNKGVLIALAAVSVLALIVWAGFAALGYFWRQRPGRIFASIARRSKGCAWRSAGTTVRARMRSKWSSPRPEHERT